jgi:hypothetical protein
VRIATAGGDARPSRVEDAARGVVVVSRPTDEAGYPVRGRPGEPVTLTWTSDWGVHEVAGTIVDTASEPVPLWTVRAEVAPPVHQRREAFRLDVRLPLELLRGEDTVVAAVVDLSEGGLGFEMPDGAPLDAGQAVRATFPLDEGDITLGGTIVRLSAARGGIRTGGLRFEALNEELATRVRRYVMQEQIRRRVSA